MVQQEEQKYKLYAALYTFVTAVVFLLILLLIVLKTPIPPYEEGGGGGLAVNFGTADDGFGTVQPENYYPLETKVTQTVVKTATNVVVGKTDQGKMLTQDIEDAPAIISNEKQTSKEDIKLNQEKVEQIKISEPVVNSAALYKRKSRLGEGITTGSGDMGKPTGDVNATNYYGEGGRGTGGTGSGTGTGDGIGSGTGVGSGAGRGISFSLQGRRSLVLSKPEYTTSEQGKVVVSITVDQSGQVIKAVAGQPGSTTSNLTLYKMAEYAALRSKFDANPNAAEVQRGTITYIFLRQN